MVVKFVMKLLTGGETTLSDNYNFLWKLPIIGLHILSMYVMSTNVTQFQLIKGGKIPSGSLELSSWIVYYKIYAFDLDR